MFVNNLEFLAAVLKKYVDLQNHVSCPFTVDTSYIWP